MLVCCPGQILPNLEFLPMGKGIVDRTIFQVSYGNIGQKVIEKKDEARDQSCYNHVITQAL